MLSRRRLMLESVGIGLASAGIFYDGNSRTSSLPERKVSEEELVYQMLFDIPSHIRDAVKYLSYQSEIPPYTDGMNMLIPFPQKYPMPRKAKEQIKLALDAYREVSASTYIEKNDDVLLLLEDVYGLLPDLDVKEANTNIYGREMAELDLANSLVNEEISRIFNRYLDLNAGDFSLTKFVGSIEMAIGTTGFIYALLNYLAKKDIVLRESEA